MAKKPRKPKGDLLKKLTELGGDIGLSVEDLLNQKCLETELRLLLRITPNKDFFNDKNKIFLKEHYPIKTKKLSFDFNVRDINKRTKPLIADNEWNELYTHQNGRCNLCGFELNHKSDIVIDHITPLSFSGSNTLDNYQLLCSTCNSGKSHYLHWIMANPFFSNLSNKDIPLNLRFAVLSKFESRCSNKNCNLNSKNSRLHVLPVVNRNKGGRNIFDNLTVLCEKHFKLVQNKKLKEIENLKTNRSGDSIKSKSFHF